MKSEFFKDIVYIGYAPLTDKTARDFFITNLIGEGANVEYWDLSKCFFKDLKINNSINEPWIKRVNKISEFKTLLLSKDKKKTIFFINFPYTGKVIRIFLILTKGKVEIGIIARGMLPIPASTVKNSIKKIFKPGMMKKAINFFFNKVALVIKRYGFVKTFDRIYYAGKDSVRIAGVGCEYDITRAKLIPINSADYDSYLMLNNIDKLIPSKYVVFLDEYLPYHPDVSMFNLTTVKADDYYESLNSFFNKIEEKFDFKVVIAAHPKAERYRTENPFKQREIFFYKTGDLIKYAEFVLAHSSTSISYAVLSNKRLLLLYTNYMKNVMGYYYNGIYHFSKALDTALINISESIEIRDDMLTLNEQKYDEYKYRFLTSKETEGVKSSEIFLETLRK